MCRDENQEVISVKTVESRNLDYNELMDYFKHVDGTAAHKESLFVPLVVAIIPAILASWKDVSSVVVAGAGVISVVLYLYHFLVVRRLTSLETETNKILEEMKPQLKEIRHYEGLCIDQLRCLFVGVLIAAWVFLWVAKDLKW